MISTTLAVSNYKCTQSVEWLGLSDARWNSSRDERDKGRGNGVYMRTTCRGMLSGDDG